MNSIQTTLSSSLSLDPLFSTIITFYALFLLYFPSQFLQILNYSPVLISTVVLLLSLLRLGTKQTELDSNPKNECILNHDQISPKLNSIYEDSFVEWDVRAPLEVISEEENDEEENREYQMSVIQRYASLSMFYPESDSDYSSSEEEDDFPMIGDCESPENVCDCDREGLIEIALDDDDRNEKRNRCREVFDEDNMIEIDLSPVR